MKPGRTYRFTVLLMSVLLVLFAAGIPVVLAACPMADDAGPACCACVDPSDGGTLRITRPMDRSCCATVIAAKGTVTEYLPSNDLLRPHSTGVCVVLPPSAADLGELPVRARVFPAGHSPPGSADTRVLLHSLII